MPSAELRNYIEKDLRIMRNFWRKLALGALLAAHAEWVSAQAPAKPLTLPDTNVEATPSVPETNVEATPSVPVTNVQVSPTQSDSPSAPNNSFENDPFLGDQNNGAQWPGGSILQGGIFSSGPVQGYRAGSSTSSTLLDVPDADIPGTVNSISSVPRYRTKRSRESCAS